jgi:hypothetical protein
MELEELIRQTIDKAVNYSIAKKKIEVIILPEDRFVTLQDACKIYGGISVNTFKKYANELGIKTYSNNMFKYSDLMKIP